jgi:hypothetical protein
MEDVESLLAVRLKEHGDRSQNQIRLELELSVYYELYEPRNESLAPKNDVGESR